jgi:hypothetical protein
VVFPFQPSKRAAVVFNYVRGFLESSPILRQEIESITASEIRLRNNVVIGTHDSFRSIRGRTLRACIFDEVSLWRDEVSATPDIEVYRAVLPSLIESGGMLIGISTPYRKVGLLYTKHRDHFGQDSDDVLIVQGATRIFNPTIAQTTINAAIADDPEGARSEWEATFRSDLAAFLDEQTIDAAVDYDRPLELPPRHEHTYFAAADPSGGRHDAFAISIAHCEGETVIIDLVRGVKPPFDPHEVTKDFAALCREYRVDETVGDRYSAEWVASAFSDAGITYTPAEKNKSELYLESLPLFTRAALRIPDHAPLLRELRLLERRTHKGGRDVVDHPRAGSDDLANSLCAAAVLAANPTFSYEGWITEEKPKVNPKDREERVKALISLLTSGAQVPF